MPPKSATHPLRNSLGGIKVLGVAVCVLFMRLFALIPHTNTHEQVLAMALRVLYVVNSQEAGRGGR